MEQNNNQVLALPYECWRWYDGYVNLYQVSTRGQVRGVDRWVTDSKGRKRFIKGRILKPRRDKNGYLCVTLSRDGKERTFKIHRMVAETWLDNPENKPEVNHLDENPGNPDVFNLSWASRIENQNWGTAIKRMADSKSKPVVAVDPKTGAVVKEFPSMNEAERNGFDSGPISACCKGKALSHKGFVWRYKDDYDQENTWTPVKIGGEAIAASRSKAVEAVDPKTGEVVLEFPSTAEGGRKGFNKGNVSACCRGVRYKTHKGYIWRFKP